MSAAATRSTRRELVAGHVRPEDFRHGAACRSVDPEVFFPVPVEGLAYRTRVAVAKAVCGGCPVREQCLSWALAHLPDGIAGGLTEHERRTEARRRRGRAPADQIAARPQCATPSELSAAGRAALAAGASVRDVADEFGVSERTAMRWARSVRPDSRSSRSTSGEGPGGNQALHQISQNDAQAGTRAEGHRG
jgi:hypothetical protein